MKKILVLLACLLTAQIAKSQSVTRFGYCRITGCTMTGIIFEANGTTSAPSYGFANFPTIGLYAVSGVLGEAMGTGQITFSGTTAAPTALTTALVVTAGNIDAGSHSYQVTYVTAGGETSAGTTSNAVVNDGTHAQNTLTAVPTGGPFVTQRKIYRNKVADQTHWFLQQTIADNTTTTGVQDNTADAGLGAAIPTSNTAIDTRASISNGGVVDANSFRATGSQSAATGVGIELQYTASSSLGAISVFDRGSPAWKDLKISGLSVQLAHSGTVDYTVTSTGVLNNVGGVFRVASSDFTLAANTSLQTITGLSWILPANTAANYPFRCEILYSQATAVVADQFGIQAASLAPTNIMAKGDVNISASTFTSGNLPTLATTTATAIVTFTPSAITTVWNARLSGFIENPSGVANTINIMAQTSNSADLVTVKRGSYCVVGF